MSQVHQAIRRTRFLARRGVAYCPAAIRERAGLRLVGADVVEVAPAYDNAEVTTVAAAHVCYELLGLMALGYL